MSSYTIVPEAKIGHVHLKVSDLERSIQFYHEVLGFTLKQRYGSSAAFMAAGHYHHHIALNTWKSEGGSPPPHGTTGLFHFAIVYPTRKALAYALKHLQSQGIELVGANDHGVSEALYLEDPDKNGIELYWDRDEDNWPRNKDGSLAMKTVQLDLDDLLQEIE